MILTTRSVTSSFWASILMLRATARLAISNFGDLADLTRMIAIPGFARRQHDGGKLLEILNKTHGDLPRFWPGHQGLAPSIMKFWDEHMRLSSAARAAPCADIGREKPVLEALALVNLPLAGIVEPQLHLSLGHDNQGNTN